jgi:hypothetical protein
MNIKSFIALGWTPHLAVVEDGTRRVVKVIAWTGGTGDVPVANQYLGPDGMVPDVADGTDIASLKDATLNYIIDGGGSAIVAGRTDYIEVPYDCTVVGWTIVADTVGSIVVDIWKDSFANFPPVLGDSIAGTEKPTLTAQLTNQNLLLISFSGSLLKGDWLAMHVDSAATVNKVTISLRIIKA